MNGPKIEGVGEASRFALFNKACKPRRFAYILTPPRPAMRAD
jgi:hypothetical protein